MSFDFSVPITWADIINVISIFIAFLAVIVAIISNCKASKSLKKTIEMQEQSKNVDLFEKRIAIIDDIQNKEKTADRPLMLLFNKEIYNTYKNMLEYSDKKLKAEQDLFVLNSNLEELDGEGNYTSPIAQLEDFERNLDEYDYPDEKVIEFESLCDNYQIVYSVSGKPEDTKVYNYREISNRIAKNGAKFDEQKQILLDSMQKFIEDSISPVS